MSETRTTPDRLERDPSGSGSQASPEAASHLRHKGFDPSREIRGAVADLNASSIWLDDNSPWRIMLTRGRHVAAVAEAHQETIPDDGAWRDGAAICTIVNEAIRLCAPAIEAGTAETRQGLGPKAESAVANGEAPANSVMLSALKAMDTALTEEWGEPDYDSGLLRSELGAGVILTWIQIRSAISQADGR